MSELEIQKELLLKQMLKMHYAYQVDLEKNIKKIEDILKITGMDKAKLKHEAINNKF